MKNRLQCSNPHPSQDVRSVLTRIFTFFLLGLVFVGSACKPAEPVTQVDASKTAAVTNIIQSLSGGAPSISDPESVPDPTPEVKKEPFSTSNEIDVVKEVLAELPLQRESEPGLGKVPEPTPPAEPENKTEDLGRAREIYNHGVKYVYGDGVPRNLVEAARLFKEAAAMGHSGAMHNLGVLYLRGEAFETNPVEARQWFLKAAELGLAEAQFKLASLYAMGQGGPRDPEGAAEWARRAAEQGHAEAQYNLATLYASGTGVEQNLTEAAKWYEQAAEKGHPIAQSNLGALYASGKGVPQNFEKAMQWLQKAAEEGHAAAQFNLGRMYNEGKGTSKNVVEAYKWLSLAAEKGDPDARRLKEELALQMTAGQVAEGIQQANRFTFKKYQELKAESDQARSASKRSQLQGPSDK